MLLATTSASLQNNAPQTRQSCTTSDLFESTSKISQSSGSICTYTRYIACLNVLTGIFVYLQLQAHVFYLDERWKCSVERKMPLETCQTQSYTPQILANIYRGVIILTTAATIAYLWLFYTTRLLHDQLRNTVSRKQSIWQSHLANSLLFDIVGCLVFPYPSLSFYNYNVIVLLSAFTLLFRISMIRQYFQFYNPMLSQDGRFVTALTRAPYDFRLILKKELDKHPLSGTFTVFVVLVTNVTFFVFVAENAYYYSVQDQLLQNPALKLQAHNLTMSQSMWLTMISATTIGYGDISVQTTGARIILALIGTVGACFNALLFSLTVRFCELNEKEAHVSSFLHRSHALQVRRESSARVIQATWRFFIAAQHSTIWIESALFSGLFYRTIRPRAVAEAKLKNCVEEFCHISRDLHTSARNDLSAMRNTKILEVCKSTVMSMRKNVKEYHQELEEIETCPRRVVIPFNERSFALSMRLECLTMEMKLEALQLKLRQIGP